MRACCAATSVELHECGTTIANMSPDPNRHAATTGTRHFSRRAKRRFQERNFLHRISQIFGRKMGGKKINFGNFGLSVPAFPLLPPASDPNPTPIFLPPIFLPFPSSPCRDSVAGRISCKCDLHFRHDSRNQEKRGVGIGVKRRDLISKEESAGAVLGRHGGQHGLILVPPGGKATNCGGTPQILP